VLLGPSGCGKSTLLNLIAGLEKPNSGTIEIAERVVNTVPAKDRDIAMVFQSYALYPSMTVRRNITFGMECRGVPKAQQQEAVARVASLLQIDGLLERKPSQLSGGQRQRVAMGRALVRDPKLFLFDEPLSNLDAQLRVDMRTEIKQLHGRIRSTIIYVTHDQIEAMTMASRIAVMNKGEIQQFAAPDEVYNRPANLFVARFLGTPPMNTLKATLVRDGDGLAATIGPAKLPLPTQSEAARAFIDRDVFLGLRPECITDSGRPGVPFEAEVLTTEPTGAETIVLASVAGERLRARARPTHNVHRRHTQRLSVRSRHREADRVRLLLRLGRERQRVALLPPHVGALRRLALGNVARVGRHDADPLLVRRHHDSIGLIFVGAEHGLQHLHDELARRVVVVQQHDLVELRLLDLGLEVRFQDVDVVTHRPLRCGYR
jgi:multiple sugar transport system ATP-binding protein